MHQLNLSTLVNIVKMLSSENHDQKYSTVNCAKYLVLGVSSSKRVKMRRKQERLFIPITEHMMKV